MGVSAVVAAAAAVVTAVAVAADMAEAEAETTPLLNGSNNQPHGSQDATNHGKSTHRKVRG